MKKTTHRVPVTQPGLIPVQVAVQRAMAQARNFYATEGIVDLTLEEVEVSEDGSQWMITLGFFLPSKRAPSDLGEMLRQIQGKTYERRYKVFQVDAKTGEVGAMKIRSL